MTQWQMRHHKAMSKTGWVVERTLGSLKRWLGAGVPRLKGQDQLHSNPGVEAIVPHGKRSPGGGCRLAKN